jgi:hypothetical protein
LKINVKFDVKLELVFTFSGSNETGCVREAFVVETGDNGLKHG